MLEMPRTPGIVPNDEHIRVAVAGKDFVPFLEIVASRRARKLCNRHDRVEAERNVPGQLVLLRQIRLENHHLLAELARHHHARVDTCERHVLLGEAIRRRCEVELHAPFGVCLVDGRRLLELRQRPRVNSVIPTAKHRMNRQANLAVRMLVLVEPLVVELVERTGGKDRVADEQNEIAPAFLTLLPDGDCQFPCGIAATARVANCHEPYRLVAPDRVRVDPRMRRRVVLRNVRRHLDDARRVSARDTVEVLRILIAVLIRAAADLAQVGQGRTALTHFIRIRTSTQTKHPHERPHRLLHSLPPSSSLWLTGNT